MKSFKIHNSNSSFGNLIKSASKGVEILKTNAYWDQKDPSPIAVPDAYNGNQIYHIYGTKGDDRTRKWEILHAVSPKPLGPWIELAPINLGIEGAGVAAPGVIYDEEAVHMFVQTEFLSLNGTIEYFISKDGGYGFERVGTVLNSIPGTNEAGIYDPQPFIVSENGKKTKYIVYTGMPRVSHGDVYIAKSLTDSWEGPYSRKLIINHELVASHHNQHDDTDYEWGLEGGNIILLPNGKFLFVGVSFLPEGQRGTRQRVFGAVADKVDGPYTSLGPIIMPEKLGENGHPGILLENEIVRIYYQERELMGPWRIKEKDFNIKDLSNLKALSY